MLSAVNVFGRTDDLAPKEGVPAAEAMATAEQPVRVVVAAPCGVSVKPTVPVGVTPPAGAVIVAVNVTP